MAEQGAWVEVRRVVLEPEQRASQLPRDTASLQYVARICGFLTRDAELGEEVEIETVTGRRLRGALVAIDPPYEHGFGAPIPELIPIGNELRLLLSGGADR